MNRTNIIVTLVLMAAVVLLSWAILNYQKLNLPLFSNYKAENLYKQAEKLNQENKPEEAVKIYEGLIKNFPKSHTAAKSLYALGQIYESKNELLKAKEAYENLLSASSGELDFMSLVQERLGNLNIKILFSNIKTKDSQAYIVPAGDTLGKIAAKFNTTVELLKKSNNLKSDNIRLGMELKVNTAKFMVMVDKSQNILTLKSSEKVVKVYNVSTGANNSTPVGTFTITNKLANPTWYTTGAIIPSGSPENILGSHWLGLSKAGYGLHGTTQPESIGKSVTQGCVRLRNSDVEELFTILPINTEVTIVD